MCHDSSGPRRLKAMLAELEAPIWDRDRVVLVIDHHVHESDDEARRIVRIAREWAREQTLPHVYDNQGICHVVVPQHGHIRPGMFCVGGDSHACTGGAFGAYMFAVGTTEMLGVLVDGTTWVRVPQTVFMRWSGRLAFGVTAKDMMLSMIGRFGMNGMHDQAVEYCGEAVSALSMSERMTLANMSAELGAQVGLIAPDDETRSWLWQAGARDIDLAPWSSDEDAPGTRHNFDASTLAPQIALPDSPAHARDVADIEPTPVQVAYIGGCTGAKIDDLRAAARVLAGYRVHPIGAPDGGAGQPARARRGAARRHPAPAGRGWRRDPAERVRPVRGLWRRAARRQHRDRVGGAQLQGPHGSRQCAGVSRLAVHGGRHCAARAHHRPARGVVGW